MRTLQLVRVVGVVDEAALALEREHQVGVLVHHFARLHQELVPAAPVRVRLDGA